MFDGAAGGGGAIGHKDRMNRLTKKGMANKEKGTKEWEIGGTEERIGDGVRGESWNVKALFSLVCGVMECYGSIHACARQQAQKLHARASTIA